jgi:hypothetical protein
VGLISPSPRILPEDQEKNLSPALPSREGSRKRRDRRLLPSLEGRAGERFFIIGLILCIAIGVGSFLFAAAIVDSLFTYRSPLKNIPPQPGPALGQPATRQVVFVLIDGLRLDTSLRTETMPVLNRLRQQGASAAMHSRPFSFSQSGYSTLLTGAWPELHDGPVINRVYADIPTWTQDNLFSAAQRAGLKTGMAGYYWFEKLVPQSALSAHFYVPGDDRAADRAVIDAALPWLGQGFHLTLIHIDQVDYAGHSEGGPFSAGGVAAARRADDLLGEILARLDLYQDTVLVCSDHGHLNGGGHGGNDPVTLLEPFVLAGAGVKPGQYGDIRMVDVAPTLAALLGINLPASSQGRPLEEMLVLPPATRVALPQAIAAQQTRLLEAYTLAIQRPLADLPQGAEVAAYQAVLERTVAERLSSERVPRWLTVGLGLLLVMGVITRLPRRTLAWVLGGALLSVALFHVRYAIWDGHAYSLSWVPGVAELAVYLLATTAVCLLVGWLVTLCGFFAPIRAEGDNINTYRLPQTALLQITLGYLVAVWGLLALPVALSYAVNGATITWVLPDMTTCFLGFLSLLQIVANAIVGVMLIGVVAMVGWYLNWKNSDGN